MSAMPERVLAYVSVFGTYSQIKDEYHDVECILVPESRLLAAEARVREVEAERDGLARHIDRRADGMDLLTQALRAALAAAEARVREMEEQASRPVPLDYGRHPITDARRDFIHHALTYPGFVGNRDLFVEAARDLAAEAATLRAERDALVPLARFAMRVHDTGDNTADAAVADGVLVWVRDSECDESPAFTQARAILAREAGE